MRYLFAEQAGRCDVRDRLDQLCMPTLVIAGGYNWVCDALRGKPA
jgi:pimeloyl-ACP methyl ester carboxylesterase